MASSTMHPLLLVAVVLAACRVERPAGYDALAAQAPTVTLSPTPWKLAGRVPRSWALSDGRRALVDIQRFTRISGMGLHRMNLAFDVWIDGATPGARLSCTTDAQANADAQARFACQSTGSSAAVTLAVAPGAPACITRDLAVLETLRDPSCWEGELVTPTARYTIRYAHFERSKHVIHQLLWTDADGRPVQAVDSVGEWRVALHRGEAPPADHDVLLLHALALHLWSHAIDGD